MISEVDVPKKCYQICQKVAKKCYQIGQKVTKMAKICQSGEKLSKWQKVAKVAKSPQIRLQEVSRGSRWFQVSNSIGSDDLEDLGLGTLRVRGARSGLS